MTLDARFSLAIQGHRAPLRVTKLTGMERVHAPFQIEVTVLADVTHGDRSSLDSEALLGAPAALELHHESAPRELFGAVSCVEEVATGYRFTITPRAAALADTVDHRVVVDRDAVEIAREVLKSHDLDVETRVTRALARRAQCVQAFESDIAFVSRILADEGVLWHLEHETGADVIVLADHPGAYLPIAGEEEIPFSAAEDAGLVGREAVVTAVLVLSEVPGKVTLSDFDPARPLVDQTVSKGQGPLERYEYPGGHADPRTGSALAQIRLEEAQRQKLVLRGTTTSPRLAPGATFKLTRAPRDDMNGRWLVLEVTHRGIDFGAGRAEDRRYEADFVAVPAALPHRPPRAKAPTLGGVQTATVTGPAGVEIHTDTQGHIKTLLRWDRRRRKDDRSSRWVRPIHPPLSGGFFLPRVGWEVLLGFQGASGDTPHALGRLSHATAPPPESLPAGKDRSAFGSLTTPGGGSGNLIRMEDAAGHEGMTLNASRDYNERTENDKTTTVGASDLHEVGSNHTSTVGIAQQITVDGAQAYSVGASRDVTAVGKLDIHAASESVSVGGDRSFKVGGDYETQAATLIRLVSGPKAEVAIQDVNRHVSGTSTILVGGSLIEVGGLSASTSVLGAAVLDVGGPLMVKARDYSLKASALHESYGARTALAGGKCVEVFNGPATYHVGGSLKLSGSTVVFKAESGITLQASGATITITESAIHVKGDFDGSAPSVVTGDETND